MSALLTWFRIPISQACDACAIISCSHMKEMMMGKIHCQFGQKPRRFSGSNRRNNGNIKNMPRTEHANLSSKLPGCRRASLQDRTNNDHRWAVWIISHLIVCLFHICSLRTCPLMARRREAERVQLSAASGTCRSNTRPPAAATNPTSAQPVCRVTRCRTAAAIPWRPPAPRARRRCLPQSHPAPHTPYSSSHDHSPRHPPQAPNASSAPLHQRPATHWPPAQLQCHLPFPQKHLRCWWRLSWRNTPQRRWTSPPPAPRRRGRWAAARCSCPAKSAGPSRLRTTSPSPPPNSSNQTTCQKQSLPLPSRFPRSQSPKITMTVLQPRSISQNQTLKTMPQLPTANCSHNRQLALSHPVWLNCCILWCLFSHLTCKLCLLVRLVWFSRKSAWASHFCLKKDFKCARVSSEPRRRFQKIRVNNRTVRVWKFQVSENLILL